MTSPPDSTPVCKKRSRNRRRRSRRSSTSCGNVSESSEESRRSQQRRNAPKRSSVEEELTGEEQLQYVAMDCEMVGVGRYGTKSALARVTIVNWNCETVYDEFIRPSEPVTDYRTFVSGITATDLESDNTVDLETCRTQVMELLQGKTLIGHALKNDLAALQIWSHPWQYTRDTGKYEPFMKTRKDDGVLWPRKLKELVSEHVGTEIQIAGQPHSAHEDACAALQLYKTVRQKWEKVMQYKIRKTAEIEEQQQAAAVEHWPSLVPAVSANL